MARALALRRRLGRGGTIGFCKRRLLTEKFGALAWREVNAGEFPRDARTVAVQIGLLKGRDGCLGGNVGTADVGAG
ncbi:hypothetical protein QP185_20570 [Sphingomonas aerolata]|uniref:hypothetical protein n=1 Tax=Sphingomonas aerolata TaxID=185951 RepID=UPI002FDF46DF